MPAPPLEKLWARLDGTNRPALETRLSVLDHGVLYGDSAYETLRTYAGKVFRLGEHLARLRRTAVGIRLELPWTDSELAAEIAALQADLQGELYIRLLVLRGVGELDYARNQAQRPTLVVLAGPFVEQPEWLYTRGLTAGLVEMRRSPHRALSPNYKTGNLLNARLAHMEARERGWQEALMLNLEGHLTEASSSNLFLVLDGVLSTPAVSDGILEGVTRNALLELAAAEGIPTRVASLGPETLEQASEAFLTSTTRAVGPIGQLGGRPLPVPGPLTTRLMELFRAHAGGL
ncbi:MAG: 4-amino-4-deoxychorismate lyase [Candidatus Xenobia bacterium]